MESRLSGIVMMYIYIYIYIYIHIYIYIYTYTVNRKMFFTHIYIYEPKVHSMRTYIFNKIINLL